MNHFAYILSTLFLSIGFFLRILKFPGANLFFLLGLLGFTLFYLLKSLLFKKYPCSKLQLGLQIMIPLMSFSIFTKYLYHPIGDLPTLIIIPVFIIILLLYFFKEPKALKHRKLTLVASIYFILCIPIFGLNINKNPTTFIPKSWYNRYDVGAGAAIVLPFDLKYEKTQMLLNEAKNYTKQGQQYQAILSYQEARKIEPESPLLLFELSAVYAQTNQLERAISLLDTAILLAPEYAPFYNNRGLLHYKLGQNPQAIENYDKALYFNQDPSVLIILHTNIALAYYYNKDRTWCCYHIEQAEKLGMKYPEFPEIFKIRNEICF